MLLVVGGVMNANATNYSIGANESDKWIIKGPMTLNDDGKYSFIINLPANYSNYLFTIFEGDEIDWNNNAFRPVGANDNWVLNNAMSLTLAKGANDKVLSYSVTSSKSRALKIEFDPTTGAFTAKRLVAVASGKNHWSTETDYLEETSTSEKYEGNVELEVTSEGQSAGYKIVSIENGNLTYRTYKKDNNIEYLDDKIDDNATVSVDGVYTLVANYNDYKWVSPIHVEKTASVTSVGYATFSSEYALDFSNVSGLKAYTVDPATTGNGVVKLTEVAGKVPAATGLLLKSEGAVSVNVPTTICTDVISNMLVASVSEVTLTAGSTPPYRYILGNDDTEGIGFYYVNETRTSAAGKAYLESNTSLAKANARVSWIFEDQETTGINSVKSASLENEVYNLNGQRVNNATRGLYIVNGKKVIMK